MSLFIDLTQKQQDARVYRIIEPKRLYELFEKNEGVLVHPSCWNDPYENFILRSKVRGKTGQVKAYTYHEHLYGQCWTLNANSDAMWRIYSPDTRGIRIRTTVRKLLESLYRDLVDQMMIDPRVSYVEFRKLKETIQRRTKFRGSILRSLLYSPPEETILEEA